MRWENLNIRFYRCVHVLSFSVFTFQFSGLKASYLPYCMNVTSMTSASMRDPEDLEQIKEKTIAKVSPYYNSRCDWDNSRIPHLMVFEIQRFNMHPLLFNSESIQSVAKQAIVSSSSNLIYEESGNHLAWIIIRIILAAWCTQYYITVSDMNISVMNCWCWIRMGCPSAYFPSNIPVVANFQISAANWFKTHKWVWIHLPNLYAS